LLTNAERAGNTDGKLTVAGLVRQFMTNHAAAKVRQSTLESYEGYECRHIVPHIGSMIARDFRRKDAEAWRKTLLEKPTANQPKGAKTPHSHLPS
jgi:hypothetical protein